MQIVRAGARLHVAMAGPSDGRVLVLLHGFTGSHVAWAPFTASLAHHGVRCLAPDLLGHGASDAPAEPARYAMDAAVDDVAAVLDTLGLRATALLGYSMGGYLALAFALRYPERVDALILESASPGIVDPEERRRRAASDEALAHLLESQGIERFVAVWERTPLLQLAPSVPETARQGLRSQRLACSPVGLAASLRGAGAGRRRPLWDELPRLDLPVLVIAGAEDERYAALAGSIAAALPRAQRALMPGAGHTVHVDQPDAFLRAVVAFLDQEQARAA
jgi:2-succinyl-6-hydroxy-2,4-cyclohexadiene-1-carboxylate synthase